MNTTTKIELQVKDLAMIREMVLQLRSNVVKDSHCCINLTMRDITKSVDLLVQNAFKLGVEHGEGKK